MGVARCEKHKDIQWGRQTWTGTEWGPCPHCTLRKRPTALDDLLDAAAKVVLALLYDEAMPRERREELAFGLDAAIREAMLRHGDGTGDER